MQRADGVRGGGCRRSKRHGGRSERGGFGGCDGDACSDAEGGGIKDQVDAAVSTTGHRAIVGHAEDASLLDAITGEAEDEGDQTPTPPPQRRNGKKK